MFQTYVGGYGKTQAHDIVFDGNHGFMGHDSNGTVEPKMSANTSVTGWMFQAGAYNITIKNNLVEACEAINSYNPDQHHIYIYNNTFRGIGSFTSYVPRGIILGSSTSYFDIQNNILTDFRSGYIDLGSSTNVTHDYNLFYNTVAEAGNPIWGGSYNTHEIHGVNPLFVTYPPSTPIVKSPAGYMLQSSSPAKDAGRTIASVINDYDGNSRPQGGDLT